MDNKAVQEIAKSTMCYLQNKINVGTIKIKE